MLLGENLNQIRYLFRARLFTNLLNIQFLCISEIRFPNESRIHIIEKKAFFNSKIQSFVIPCSITHICEVEFAHCDQLSTTDIANISELHIIDKKAFAYTQIQNFKIPLHLSQI